MYLLADMATRATAKSGRTYHDSTTLEPVAAILLVILACWLFQARRRAALWPILTLICFIPSAQRLVIAGADFTLLRLIVIAGLIRIVLHREYKFGRPAVFDCVYFAWVILGSLVYVAQQQDLGSAVYVTGMSLDMLGAYTLFRVFIRSIDDLWALVRMIAWLSIPVCCLFCIELTTGRNVFNIFGGVPEFTSIRDGRLRCQGAFAHPILAGVFWASFAPIMMAAAVSARDKALYIFAFLSCVLIVIASGSSTPVLGLATGMLFFALWPTRRWIGHAVVLLPIALCALHLMMEAPVWHLISRVSAVGGSTGYHRYVLIDSAINHVSEWWLVGTPSTVHWSDDIQTFDIANQYVFEGVRGGIWRLGMFLLLIALATRSFLRGVRRCGPRSDRFLMWGLSASLFVHCASFIGVSYFGQIQYLWYAILAISGSVGAPKFFSNARKRSHKSRSLHQSSIIPYSTRTTSLDFSSAQELY